MAKTSKTVGRKKQRMEAAIDLKPRPFSWSQARGRHLCGYQRLSVMKGYGDSNFQFPTVTQLVNGSLAYIASSDAPRRHAEEKANAQMDDQDELVSLAQKLDAADAAYACRHSSPESTTGGAATCSNYEDGNLIDALVRSVGRPTCGSGIDIHHVPSASGVIPSLPEELSSGVDATLYWLTEGLREYLFEGRFDAIIAERFDPLKGSVSWARLNMAARYQPAILSLEKQLASLEALYRQSLPRALSVLEGQNPDVPKRKLLEAALEGLDVQVERILLVLRVWTDAFGQRRDGMYRELEAVTFVIEECFKLMKTGDLEGCGKENCEQPVRTVVFQVGNVFVTRFGPEGPQTRPGTRGPVGAHAVEVSQKERKILPFLFCCYTHEFRHDAFADIVGLADELIAVLEAAIREGHASGKIKFLAETIALGGHKLPAIDMHVKIAADTIGEVDADISGGVLLSGPAYLFEMIPIFSAFNTLEARVVRSDKLLRASSFYELTKGDNDSVTLDFLPHPPDYIRAYIVAAALDEIGFTTEANLCRKLADQAAGTPTPQYITWHDYEGKSKTVVRVPVEDLRQVAPVVARALIRTPLVALGGKCIFEYINWDSRRQAKVDLLAANLMAGSADVPLNAGDYFGTYVGPAAILALWGLVKSGWHVVLAIKHIVPNVYKMIDTIRERQAAPAAGPATECACEVANPAPKG
jgi:hypothetical protein